LENINSWEYGDLSNVHTSYHFFWKVPKGFVPQGFGTFKKWGLVGDLQVIGEGPQRG
jgi:hypothetical protein